METGREKLQAPVGLPIAQASWAFDCLTNRDADRMNAMGMRSTEQIPRVSRQAPGRNSKQWLLLARKNRPGTVRVCWFVWPLCWKKHAEVLFRHLVFFPAGCALRSWEFR